MKEMQQKMIGLMGRVDKKAIQIIFIVVTLSLLVIGGGAPEMDSGPGGPGPLSVFLGSFF